MDTFFLQSQKTFLPATNFSNLLSYVYRYHCVRTTAITALTHPSFDARQLMTVSGHIHESSVR